MMLSEKMKSLSNVPLDAQMERYVERYPNEVERLKPLLNQFDSNMEMFDRATLPGHITASGIVVKDGRMLMIYHTYLQKWLQPGGHVDEGETPLHAAIREVLEETGISCKLHPWHEKNQLPIDINIHTIPTNPTKQEWEHFHYDFRYLLCVDDSQAIKTEKDHEISWLKTRNINEDNLENLLGKVIHEMRGF